MAITLPNSRAGALIYSELPEAHRVYDNRRAPDGAGTGRFGDLEAYLYALGHLLDRVDSTVEQFLADGFAEPLPNGRTMQPWLVEYYAETFGVRLRSATHEGRLRELADAAWIARRRGTFAGVRQGVRAVLAQASVAVHGVDRVLRTPMIAEPPLTHFEKSGLWHPADATILREALPAGDQVIGLRARRPIAHAGLSPGTPDVRLVMRAVPASVTQMDAETRPAAGGVAEPIRFAVRSRRGRACFPKSFEDRRLVTPDIRADRPNRRRHTPQANPSTLTAFVRPPAGLFTGAETLLVAAAVTEDFAPIEPGATPAEIATARAARPIVADPAVLHRPAAPIVVERSADGGFRADAASLTIRDLRLDGTLEIAVDGDETVILENCAVRDVVIRVAAEDAQVIVRGSVFETITREGEGAGRLILDSVTVMDAVDVTRLFASETIFAGPLTVREPEGGGMDGCVRFSRVPAGALSGPQRAFHAYASSEGPVRFVLHPCLPVGDGTFEARAARFGEEGYAVLSDESEPAIAQGAEDGGEVGAYHAAGHLAALAATHEKAVDLMAPEQRFFARYDERLLIGGGEP